MEREILGVRVSAEASGRRKNRAAIDNRDRAADLVVRRIVVIGIICSVQGGCGFLSASSGGSSSSPFLQRLITSVNTVGLLFLKLTLRSKIFLPLMPRSFWTIVYLIFSNHPSETPVLAVLSKEPVRTSRIETVLCWSGPAP
jgi:hypothetical protein